MQRDDGIFQLPQRAGLVGAYPGADQLSGRASQGLIGLVGNGGPVGVAGACPPVPFRVDFSEPQAGVLQPFDRYGAGCGHVDVEDTGEGGFVRQEAQERPDSDA